MTFRAISGILAVALTATAVFAGGHSASPEQKAVSARQAHMKLYAFNLGILGDMAKGKVEFNADIAQEAAGNLAAVASLGQMSYWPAGTSNADMGEATRTLPAAWENVPDLIAKGQALTDAANAMKDAAGTLEGVRANMEAVGKSCGGCHKPYRAP